MQFPHQQVFNRELAIPTFKSLPKALPILIVSILVGMACLVHNFYSVTSNAKNIGHDAVILLEKKFQNVADELTTLYSQIDERCSIRSENLMMRYVFDSPLVKEVVLSRNGVTVCSSSRALSTLPKQASVPLVGENGVRTHIRVVDSNFAQQLIVVSVAIDAQRSISAYIPPKQITSRVFANVQSDLFSYNLFIDRHSVAETHSYESLLNEPARFFSSEFPINLEVQTQKLAFIQAVYNSLLSTLLYIALAVSLYLLIRFQLLSKRSVEYSLSHAINRNEIDLIFQPIVDSRSNKLVGAEALARWQHPKLGSISPDVFIPLAERIGVIGRITEKTMESVASFMYRHRNELQGVYFSVNISRTLILDLSFRRFLTQYAATHAYLIPNLMLEITENMEFGDHTTDEIQIALDELTMLGFRLAVDDFGTGYSGLQFIRTHPFNVMKIDKIFVNTLDSRQEIEPVLASMIRLGKELDMEVIAEGVETTAQLDALKRLGVHYIQGYYYSKPIKASCLIEMSQQSKQMTPQWIKALE